MSTTDFTDKNWHAVHTGYWSSLPNLDSDETLALMRRKARQLSRKGFIHSQDEDDVVQELALRLIPAAEHYRSERGPWETFVSGTLENAAVSLGRFRRAKKRHGGYQVSLNLRIPSAGDREIIELLSPDLNGRCARPPKPAENRSDVRQDIRDIVASLSKPDRHLCRLASRMAIKEISALTGTPRTTIQSRLKRLRKQFKELKNF